MLLYNTDLSPHHSWLFQTEILQAAYLSLGGKLFLVRRVVTAVFTRDQIRLEPIRNWYGQAMCLQETWWI